MDADDLNWTNSKESLCCSTVDDDIDAGNDGGANGCGVVGGGHIH